MLGLLEKVDAKAENVRKDPFKFASAPSASQEKEDGLRFVWLSQICHIGDFRTYFFWKDKHQFQQIKD